MHDCIQLFLQFLILVAVYCGKYSCWQSHLHSHDLCMCSRRLLQHVRNDGRQLSVVRAIRHLCGRLVLYVYNCVVRVVVCGRNTLLYTCMVQVAKFMIVCMLRMQHPPAQLSIVIEQATLIAFTNRTGSFVMPVYVTVARFGYHKQMHMIR